MKDAHVVVRIEEKKLADLKRIAKKRDRPVSYLIRRAIDQFVERETADASEDPASGHKSSRQK